MQRKYLQISICATPSQLPFVFYVALLIKHKKSSENHRFVAYERFCL